LRRADQVGAIPGGEGRNVDALPVEFGFDPLTQQPGDPPLLQRRSGSSMIARSWRQSASATRFIASRARSISESSAICTSSSARDQCCEMFPARWICPLDTCHTVPSTDRIRVARSVTASTAPVTSPRSTQSPTPNWSSTRMNRPAMTSRISDCAPNPSATPIKPAPVSSGPSRTPSTRSTASVAITHTTKLVAPASATASASIR
jgi:hypothetical protein